MKENEAVIGQEVAMPNAEEATVAPAAETGTQAEDIPAGAVAKQPEQESDASSEPVAQTVGIPYNHKVVEVEMPTVIDYCQQFMHLSRNGGTLEKLNRLADYRGVTADDLLNGLLTAHDDSRREQLLRECNGDEALADSRFAAEQAQREQAQRGNASFAPIPSVNERLAEEFAGMQADFGMTDFREVPLPAGALA